jgi:hypothetical protein
MITENVPLSCEKPEVDIAEKRASTPKVAVEDTPGAKDDDTDSQHTDGSDLPTDTSPGSNKLLATILFGNT